MKFGDVDGLGVVYDEEAELLLSERERLYGRRGLTIDAFEGGFPRRRPLLTSSLFMVFYTNQRIVGLRDLTAQEEEVYLGTLRAIDRDKFLGPRAQAHHVLSYFAYPLREIVGLRKRGRRHLRQFVQDGERRYEFRYRPWGAACRFFSILLRGKEKG